MAITNEKTNAESMKISYSDGFMDAFNESMNVIDGLLNKLNSLKNEKFDIGHGICNASYKIRYITPTDISTYIDALSKLIMKNNGCTYCSFENDINAITVAMVKKFIKDNNCVPFESSFFQNGEYINPTMSNLVDLIMSCENDVYSQCVYSPWELKKRVEEESFVNDVKRVNETYFMSTTKRIISNLPKILEKAGCICDASIVITIEQFILFACTLYSITIQSMLDYAKPSSEYVPNTFISKDNKTSSLDNADHPFIECAMIRTMDLELCSNVPHLFNMRDIVLQDMTDGFKEVMSALKFILSDTRSPISILVNQFGNKGATILSNNEMRFIRGIIDSATQSMPITDMEKAYNNVNFRTELNWIDKIAYGNNFLNGNYRRDQVGNQHIDGIPDTLNMIYKLYSSNELTTNEDLANNIISVSRVIENIIMDNKERSDLNIDFIKDTLSLLGEIMTRNMIKLYHNNTQVIDASDVMEDAMTPGYIYNESFVIMEAGEGVDGNAKPDTPQPTVSNSNEQTSGGIAKKVMNSVTKIIKQFIDWIQKQMSSYGAKFNQDHKREIEWITKNQKLNAEIAAALNNKTFHPNVTNLPLFDIPAQELGNVDVDKVINDTLNSKDPIDANAIKAKLYPQAVASQIINIKDEAEQVAALTNYILYKQIKPKAPYSGILKADMWNDIIEDLLNTGKLIETQCKKTSDSLKQACTTLSNKAKEEEAKKASAKPTTDTTTPGNTDNSSDGSDDRATQLLPSVQSVSKNYYVNMLNVLRSKFYATNYKVYRDIINAYKQQTTSTQQQSNAQTSTTQQQQTTPTNPDDLSMDNTSGQKS